MNENNEIRELTQEEYNALSKTEKQKYSYKKNKIARDKWKAEMWAQQEKDRAANMEALRSIRDDRRTPPALRKFAILALDDAMGLNCIPYYLVEPLRDAARRSDKKNIDEFREMLKSRHPELWAEAHADESRDCKS